MSTPSDPLAGLERPPGSAGEMQALASTWTGGSEALGHTSQVLVGMVGRLLAQAWSGQAAMACAGACSRDAATIAMAADAYQIGGAALRRFAGELAAAQAMYDRARALADQAIAEEEQHQQNAARLLPAPGGLFNPAAGLGFGDSGYVSPARTQARAMAEQAISDAQHAATAAAVALEATIKPFLPKPAAKPKPEHHWYSPVTDFLGGAWDSVKDPVVMVGGLVGLHGDIGQNWADLGKGLAHGFTHPLDLGKAIIDWNDLSAGHYSRWAGELVPSAVAAFFTGGGAAAVKGADALNATARTGKALEDLSDAEKASVLARGEALVPGASAGQEATARYLTDTGRLDYSYNIQNELNNFRTITSNGTVTLGNDLYLANLHDGTAALNAGRSLKYGAPLDSVLANTRGGFLQKTALVPQWGKRTDMSLIKIPAGTDVTMTTGTTSAQISTHSLEVAGRKLTLPTGVKIGGGPQVLLHNVDRQWVVWTGKAPWADAAPNLVKGTAAGTAAAGVIRAPDVLSDLATTPGG